MKATVGEIRDSVNKLCFLEASEYDEYKQRILEAINYAQFEVVKTIPLQATYEIDHTAADADGYDIYDLAELTASGGVDIFAGFVAAIDKSTGEAIDYIIYADKLLSLPKRYNGTALIFFNKYPLKITSETADAYEIELNMDCANCISLLAASRVYKDDDIQKSTMYYNEFIDEFEKLANKPRSKQSVAIIGGVEL